jgi:hypothetical protein
MATAGTPEFAATTIDHVFEIWIWPEVQRRNLSLSRTQIRKALVELAPGKAPRILLNDEAELVAGFVPKRTIAEGEEVTLGDIDRITDIRPLSVGADSGWLVFARIASQEIVTFDFRYNRAKALEIIKRAREFLTIAKVAADTSAAVALDLMFSAAELAVHSQMMTLQSEVSNHQERARWLTQWARNGNAPGSYSELLYNLADLRSSARYGEGQLRMHPRRLPNILHTVEEMIQSAEAQISSDVSKDGEDRVGQTTE